MLALIAAAPELGTPDETDNFLNAMPIPDLASLWCVLQRLSRRDQTAGAWAAKMYFDHLPHRKPDRALELALEVLRSESDKATVMQLNDKFMMALMYAHGADVIERIEREAEDNARLRWLLGGVHFGPDEELKDRIEAIADRDAWRAMRSRAKRRNIRSIAKRCRRRAGAGLGRAISESERDCDDNFFAMMDYERELREEDPTAIDVIVEILKIETNPALLSLLAAGPLEDVISMATIDRFECEALRTSASMICSKVHGTIGPDELKARLDPLIGDAGW